MTSKPRKTQERPRENDTRKTRRNDTNTTNPDKPRQGTLEEPSLWYSLPVQLCDLVFIMWIYVALVSILQHLRQRNETYKLELYTKLARTLAVFIVFIALLTIVELCSDWGLFTWSWRYVWVEFVPWR